MSTLSKTLLGSAIAFVIIASALGFFFYHLVTKSFPQTSGTISVTGLHKPTEILRDSWGVPHISAQNEHDLMMTIGYVHAQERLWQMELSRRAGMGRLSEILDTPTVKYDKMFRTLGFTRLAEKLERAMHPDSRRLLQDYTDGINAYITANKGNYPIEFDMLKFEPEPWTVQHSLIVARLLAWELNFAWWTDLTYAEILNRVGNEKFQEYLPKATADSPPLEATQEHKNLSSHLQEQEIHSLLALGKSYREYFGYGALTGASNAWVISGAKSLSGMPILANDPHLRVSAPNWWYEAHLSAPGWNVAGVTLAGTPFVLIGHNDSLAWGFTNAMLDDADFYIEEEDTVKPYYYRFKGASVPMEVHEEIIRVKSTDSITITVRSTHHGPIINDVNTALAHSDSLRKRPVSLRWTGFEMSDEFHGFYLMNRAGNIVEFEHGLRELTVPAQTAVYADVQGNIASWLAASVPVRSSSAPMLPLNGWSGTDEWNGFVPFEELPAEINPERGFIVRANHVLGSAGYKRYLSTLWEPSSRYRRIEQLLAESEKSSSDDFKLIQQDVLSLYGKMLSRHILTAYDRDSTASGEVKKALEYLKNWDFRCTPTDIATTIVNQFFVSFLHATLEDELGADIFNDAIYFSGLPYRTAEQLLNADSSSWFDNVATPEHIETKNEIIKVSFRRSLDTLTAQLGAEMKLWQWGAVHQIEFAHPFGARKPLDKIFNVGPYPVGGSATTVWKGDFKLSSPFKVFSAPSMRSIVDLATPRQAFMINQLGQSGQPFHSHYEDQTPLWLNGGYRTVSIDWNIIRSESKEQVELLPPDISVTN